MPDTILKEAKILIVDDERANVRFLEIVLQQAGYQNVFSTTDPRRALSLCSELQLDLLLLDLHMPHLDGFTVMEILQAEPEFVMVPILVLTADGTMAIRHRALAEGAKDFLIKPLDEVEVLLRIQNLLETRFRNEMLEAKVREAQRFMLSIFDALPSHVAVLDHEGRILEVNRAWRTFSDANDGDARMCRIGANYLDACERASACAKQEGRAVAQGIRRVIAREVQEFHLEYSCHSSQDRRWFTVRVTPFIGEGTAQVVVAHENITERKLAEEALEQAQWETIQRLTRASEALAELKKQSGNPFDPQVVEALLRRPRGDRL